jgi:hypothetical protein
MDSENENQNIVLRRFTLTPEELESLEVKN